MAGDKYHVDHYPTYGCKPQRKASNVSKSVADKYAEEMSAVEAGEFRVVPSTEKESKKK
jgi:hypothetical protein